MHRQRVERDAAHSVLQLGGHLTDDTERRLMQHLLRNWSFPSSAPERDET
jgi:hypothetical protein